MGTLYAPDKEYTWTRSGLTHRVDMGEGSKLTIHCSFQKLISDQLRFIG